MGLRRVVAALSVVALPLIAVTVAPSAANAQPGTLDPSFGSGGISINTAAASGATGVAIATSGAAVGDIAVSCCGSTTGSPHFEVDLYNSQGGRLWGAAPVAGNAEAVAVRQSDDEVIAAGDESGTACGGSTVPFVAAFTPSGGLSWATPIPCAVGSHGGRLNGVAVESDGSIVAGGVVLNAAANPQMLEVHLSAGGAVVGLPATPAIAARSAGQAVAIAANGDALVGGYTIGASQVQVLTVAAFNSSGALDTTFGAGTGFATASSGEIANGLVVLPGGNVVAAGSTLGGSSFLAQFQSNGTLDGSFGSGGQLTATGSGFGGVAYQPFGDILVAAGQTGGPTGPSLIAQYYPSNGAPLGSFGTSGSATFTPGGFPSFLAGVAVQPDGKTVGAGSGSATTATPAEMVARVLGPALSVGSIGTIQVDTLGFVTLLFPISIDMTLPAAVPAYVCGSPGDNVDGQGQCAVVPIQSGTVNVPMTVPVSAGTGSQQTAVLSVRSANGLAANPAKSAGTAVIQHTPPPPPAPGYWLAASDGGIFAFGGLGFFGSTGGIHLRQPIVAMAATSDDRGYWLVASDGGIFAFGDAGFYGSTGGIHLRQPIVGMAATPDGRGYWLVARDGGIFAFGDAAFHGSTGGIHLTQPIVGMASTLNGQGYWLVASDGGVFAFGDAGFYGSTGGIHLAKPIVGMAPYPGGPGYWMVASDGGIFSFGVAGFHGSTGGIHLREPIVGMKPTFNGQGYWMVASDGGIFAFGNATFQGSTGGIHLTKPIIGMTG